MPAFYVYELIFGLSTFPVLPTPLITPYVITYVIDSLLLDLKIITCLFYPLSLVSVTTIQLLCCGMVDVHTRVMYQGNYYVRIIL